MDLIKIDRNGKETMLQMSQRIEKAQIDQVNLVLE